MARENKGAYQRRGGITIHAQTRLRGSVHGDDKAPSTLDTMRRAKQHATQTAFCNNSAVHNGTTKQCTMQQPALFVHILIADENLSKQPRIFAKMLTRRSRRQLQNVRKVNKCRRKFLMLFCIIYQYFFADERQQDGSLPKCLW